VTVANLMVLANVKTVNAPNLNALKKMIVVNKRPAVKLVIVVRMVNVPVKTAQHQKVVLRKLNVVRQKNAV
jgi:hypothetical protein